MKQIVEEQVVDVPEGERSFKKLVNGELVDMSAEEISVQQGQEAEWESQKARAMVIEQIQALEVLETPRRLSEAILGIDGAWLADNRAKIALLRGQL